MKGQISRNLTREGKAILKKCLFPVQRVANIVASRAAADLFLPFGKKNGKKKSTITKKKKKKK